MKISKLLSTETTWNIVSNTYDKKQAITDGSNFMIGNGYLGYRGTFAEDKKEDYVGCFVTDTWDKADDKWEELCNVPNALFIELSYKDTPLNLNESAVSYRRELDVRSALTSIDVTVNLPNQVKLRVEEEKFASYAKKQVVALKYTLTSSEDIKLDLVHGIDIDTWNINGEHLENHKSLRIDKLRGVSATTHLYKDTVVVLEKSPDLCIDTNDLTKTTINLQKNTPYVIHKYMIVCSSNDADDPQACALDVVNSLQDYETELHLHKQEWDDLWNHFDIKIKGDQVAQISYRFNTYHSIIATPVHKSLPIGARGLSCQAYQGSAFWDQEIFSLPMYLYAKPSISKQILSYRFNTLDGARRKAKIHGYEGAFYAWISGKTGDELCPDFFFKDVITNRKIRNHFNLWQIHISPDIAYAIKKYYEATLDDDFMINEGLEMMFEICRFLASRVDYKPRRDRYEIIRVQGPDEYHENVDNNAFTNYQTHLCFAWTIEFMEQFAYAIKPIIDKIHVTNKEVTLWRDILEKLYIPSPNQDLIIEQFDDYFTLESIVPAINIKSRLLDPEEYYGWPNGIAVFTQCLKQADVIQLLHMHPHMFPYDVVKANYDYYEPRTLHFSSLSPSIHSIIACRINDLHRARIYFNKALSIDLLNTNEAVSGGTFIGGMHTAANAAVWQMMVFGFAGFSFENNTVRFNPHLLPEWEQISFKLVIRGQDLDITISQSELTITNNTNTKNIMLSVNDKPFEITDQLSIQYK